MILKFWFIIIFAKPGQGKSLEQARITEKLFKEYHKTEKKYPELRKRFVFTNQIMNPDITLAEKKDGHLHYWEEPEHLRYCPIKNCWKAKVAHRLHDCDLLVDEGATLFPAKGGQGEIDSTNTPNWLRKLWAQHRHNGIRIVMLTQDFKGIALPIRRMVWASYQMKKMFGSRDISPSLPPLVRWSWINWLHPARHVVWGMYYRRRIDPLLMETDPHQIMIIQKDKEQVEALRDLKLIGRPEIHLITWHKVNLYDTTQDVKEYVVKREVEYIEVACGKYHLDPKTGKKSKVKCDYVLRQHKLKN